MGDEQFLDIAKDPVQAKALRHALRRLAGGGAGPALAEMATEVLAGRLDLRRAVFSAAYTEALNSRVQSFTSYYGTLSDQEKDELAELGRAQLDELRQEDESAPVAPVKPLPRRRAVVDVEEEGPPATYRRGPER